MQPAGRRREAAGDDLDQRRLARAVVAEERHHLAAVDAEAHAAKRFDRAEMLGDAVEDEEGLAFAHAARAPDASTMGSRGRPRVPSANIMPKRGDSTPETASAAAPRSTASWPTGESVDARRAAVAPRGDRIGERCGGLGEAFEQPPWRETADHDGLRVEQVLDGDEGGAEERCCVGDPAILADNAGTPLPSFE